MYTKCHESRLRLLPGLALLLLLGACAREERAPVAAASVDETAQVRARLDDIQAVFNRGDLDALIDEFTEDAVIAGQGEPDIVGREAIRKVYETALAQVAMQVTFRTEEIHQAGDLAYEKGTYTVALTDKATGKPLGMMDNRHVHILRKGADGKWRTWRMIVNTSRGGPPPPLPPEPVAPPTT